MGKIQIKRYKQVKQEELEKQVKYYQSLLRANNIVEYDETEEHPQKKDSP